MQPLRISKNPPRRIEELKKITTRGLKPYYFFGWFAILGMLLPIIMVISLSPPGEDLPLGRMIFALAIFSSLGIILLRHAGNKRRMRENALASGEIVTADVVDKGREFVFYKSVRDYTVTVQFTDRSGISRRVVLKSGDPALHNIQIEDKLAGLMDYTTNSLFFPVEFGYNLEVE